MGVCSLQVKSVLSPIKSIQLFPRFPANPQGYLRTRAREGRLRSVPKTIPSGHFCAVCGRKILHREGGSGRHAWRYCDESCRREAGRLAKFPKRLRPILRKVRP